MEELLQCIADSIDTSYIGHGEDLMTEPIAVVVSSITVVVKKVHYGALDLLGL